MLLELGRKLFHFLCLVYLTAFHLWGRSTTLKAVGAWFCVVVAVEALRLTVPKVNAFLLTSFRGIHRPAEEHRPSGIVWTSAGCWLTMAVFGAEPRLVDGGIVFLAFGDAAAALVGKAAGRHPFTFRGRRKSLEGSLACFAACAASGAALGFGRVSLAAAAAATAVELAAPPPDDNFWLPLVSALVLSLG